MLQTQSGGKRCGRSGFHDKTNGFGQCLDLRLLALAQGMQRLSSAAELGALAQSG
ncbi:MAG: hypothetical protein M0P52_06430 [Rhodoferax sp.]|nr:hypothetical protein [Rhodoferax sp.]